MVSEPISSASSCVRQSAATAAGRFNLRGRVVVVTGASKGIGRELTVLLAETGAVVVPTVRTDADAADLASEAQSRGLTVHPQRLDVRDVASITEAVSGIVAAHGGIDVLVNNAGLGFAIGDYLRSNEVLDRTTPTH